MVVILEGERRSLRDWLDREADASSQLVALVESIAVGCTAISNLVRKGDLGDAFGSAGRWNVQGEEQQALDLTANELMKAAASASGQVAAIATEEEEEPVIFQGLDAAPYLLLFDPLDGSSNIKVNAGIGTIFSIIRAPGRPIEKKDFLLPGRLQTAAGYVIYGPQTVLVLTVGGEVCAFTLDPEGGQWLLTSKAMTIPNVTAEFAINMSNYRYWAPPIRGYVDDCLAGRDGVRAKDFNMRWVAAMVADVHRILFRGGVFLYPWDRRAPERAGKLRLLYEANPMSLIVERAGGAATDTRMRILDIEPTDLHQRVAVILGSQAEVDRITSAHEA